MIWRYFTHMGKRVVKPPKIYFDFKSSFYLPYKTDLSKLHFLPKNFTYESIVWDDAEGQ
jgi:hypothetical protein